MNREHLLSIISVNKNNGIGLRKTIESVVAQKTEDVEFVLIDGGSIDSSLDVAKEYSSYIDVLVSEPDKGIYHAMNKGVTRASGKYCMFLNSGDWLIESTLADFLKILVAGGDVVYGDIRAVSPDGMYDIPLPRSVSPFFFFRSTINHQNSAILKELLLERPYDESMQILADRDWFLKASLEGRTFVHAGMAIAHYDMGGISATSKGKASAESKMLIEKWISRPIQADYSYFDEVMRSDWFYWKEFVERHHILQGLLFIVFRAVRKLDFIRERFAHGKKKG